MSDNSPIRILRIIARLNVGGPAIQAISLTSELSSDCYQSMLVCGNVSPYEGDMAYLAAEKGVQPFAVPELGREISLTNDWKALLAWMNASPALYALLRPIYLSLTLQMTTVTLCLAFSGRLVWLRVYTLAFVAAVLISIAISAVLPAAGAWPHYGLSSADSQIMPAVSSSWPVFYGLREGTFRLLVAVGDGEGGPREALVQRR